MAAVKSTIVTNLDAVPKVQAGYEHGARLIAYTESYEAASLAATSTIAMVRVQTGDRICVGLSKLAFDALGASTALTVGDQYDTDRFCTSISSVAAACKFFDVLDSEGYTYTCDQDILIGLGNGTATGTITLTVVVQRPG